MSDFGDWDPEDAYDAGDPVDVRLRVIGLAILSAREDPVRRAVRLAGARRLLRRLADELEDDG